MGLVQEISNWPKVSKFTVSACAASVAELGNKVTKMLNILHILIQ